MADSGFTVSKGCLSIVLAAITLAALPFILGAFGLIGLATCVGAAKNIGTPSPSVTISATPLPKPTTEIEARRQAVLMYPQLGVPGSAFNTQFLQRVADYRRTKPDLFASPDWPITVARETAAGLP